MILRIMNDLNLINQRGTYLKFVEYEQEGGSLRVRDTRLYLVHHK